MCEKTNFRRFGTMIDSSRNAVMKVEALKKWVDTTANIGYNTLLLYTEDTYEVDNQPYFGHLRGRYSKEELKEIDDYTAEKGMEFIPCIQTLAHLNAIMRWPEYSEIRDCDDILLAGPDKTYALVEDMFSTLAGTIRGRQINVGMDEAHMLGRGRYYDYYGDADRSEILVTHLSRVAEIAGKYGFELTMWGDMFFRMINGGSYYADGTIDVSEEIKAKIPSNVNLVYWDYYSLDKAHYDRHIKAHKAIKDNIWFAGGLFSWMGFAPHNGFSMNATAAAITSCIENNVQDVFLTFWGDDGGECSKFSLLPSLFFSSEYAKGNTDLAQIKESFRVKYGISFDDFMLLDLTGTPNECDQKICNPEKYMFYNDCFMGMFDDMVSDGDGESFARCAEKLAALEENSSFGYIFKTEKRLCDLLAVKIHIGVRTRKAYLAGDKSELKVIIGDYDLILQRISDFYEAFAEQWEIENKPHGFDIQDNRIGGLLMRVRHCRNRLQKYVNGEIQCIEELNEPVLRYDCGGVRQNPEHCCVNGWNFIISPNCI